MKRALVSFAEPREGGVRVAQVVATGEDFPVAPGMEWVDCPDDVEADKHWFDPVDSTFTAFPVVLTDFTGATAAVDQPSTEGTVAL